MRLDPSPLVRLEKKDVIGETSFPPSKQRFRMGSVHPKDGGLKPRNVTVPESFAIEKYPVSNIQFYLFMEDMKKISKMV